MQGFRLAAVAFSVVLAASAAAAADIGGAYAVSGTNFDGSSYSGTAKITSTSETTCRIVWTTGGTSSSGICMRYENMLTAGYVLGKDIGLVLYELQGDGTLKGVWTLADHDGAGTEVLTPQH